MQWSTLISIEDLLRHLRDGDVQIIDCRFSLGDTEWGRTAYNEGHIPGAVYAHLDSDLSGPLHPGSGRHPLPDPVHFKQTLERFGIANTDQVVVYDQDSGGIAARAWWLLRWVGHDRVAVLDGGWDAWKNAGLPLSNNRPVSGRTTFVLNMRHDLAVDARAISLWARDRDYTVVDSRTHARYTGEDEPIDPVAGHIPGAISIPFPMNLDNGLWRSREELRHRFKAVGPPDRTAFYCGSGVTACHNILAYKHAGLGDALLYPGSWSEWIADPDRPVGTGPES